MEHHGEDTPFHTIPTVRRLVHQVEVRYHNDPAIFKGGDQHLLSRIIANTPLPKGKDEFSSLHLIGPPKEANAGVAEAILSNLQTGNASKLKKELHIHRLPAASCPQPSAMDEYEAIFRVASELILRKADRASLLIFVGWEDSRFDFYAAVIGMLPFRGLSAAYYYHIWTYNPRFYSLYRHLHSAGHTAGGLWGPVGL